VPLQLSYGEQERDGGALRPRFLRLDAAGQVDIDHVAEEIEDMGKERRHALKSQARRLVVHLLKWEFQPQLRTRSWLRSMASARVEISDVLQQNPSLNAMTPDLPREVYKQAVKLAIADTNLSLNAFPATCPYTFEEIMNDEFLPGAPLPDPRV
jgi:hypothetical protein